jgi:hypothetical protein
MEMISLNNALEHHIPDLFRNLDASYPSTGSDSFSAMATSIVDSLCTVVRQLPRYPGTLTVSAEQQGTMGKGIIQFRHDDPYTTLVDTQGRPLTGFSDIVAMGFGKDKDLDDTIYVRNAHTLNQGPLARKPITIKKAESIVGTRQDVPTTATHQVINAMATDLFWLEQRMQNASRDWLDRP